MVRGYKGMSYVSSIDDHFSVQPKFELMKGWRCLLYVYTCVCVWWRKHIYDGALIHRDHDRPTVPAMTFGVINAYWVSSGCDLNDIDM